MYIDYQRWIIYCDIWEVPVMTNYNYNWLDYVISCRLLIESDKRSNVKWTDIHSNIKIYKILEKHYSLTYKSK